MSAPTAPAESPVQDAAAQTTVIDHIPYPAKSGSFVAYQRDPWTAPDPTTGERTTVRPETYVRMFRSIGVVGVTEAQTAGRRGELFSTLQVKFSAASVGVEGFRNDFGANCRADSRIAEVIRWAAGNPEHRIALIIETRRKAKDKSGEPIPRQSGILALRSGKTITGDANANATGETCVNIVAGVGKVAADGSISTLWSGEAVSDPAEFVDLARNQPGDLPPVGWRRVTDGVTVSFITPSASASASAGSAAAHVAPGAGLSVDGMADLVNAAVASAVAEAAAALQDSMAGKLDNVLLRLGVSGDSPQTRQATGAELPAGIRSRARAREARPWEPRNGDGRVNANGYLVKQQRVALELALGMFTGARDAEPDAMPAAEQWDARIHGLQQRLVWMAGRVQEQVVGVENRLAESHSTSLGWVRTVTDWYLPLPAAALADPAAATAWSTQVIDRAAGLYRGAMVDVGEYLSVDPDLPQSGAQGEHPLHERVNV